MQNELRAALLARQQPERAVLLGRFFKTGPGQYGAGDQFLGLTMPEQHALVRQYRELDPAAVEALLQDPYHECRMTGLLIWVDQVKRGNGALREDRMARYLAHRAFVNNWDLVDVSCPYVLGLPLLTGDRSVLTGLARETDLWGPRIALVTTLAFIRKGQFADTFALVEQLMNHPHDLIHKAMGWMLREVGKREPAALTEFLHDYRFRIPRTTLRYAIERLSPDERRYYMRRRDQL